VANCAGFSTKLEPSHQATPAPIKAIDALVSILPRLIVARARLAVVTVIV
jgi:hypothetical protein